MRKLNLKNMCEAIDQIRDAEDKQRVFDVFRVMVSLGFISDESWKKFFEKYKAL